MEARPSEEGFGSGSSSLCVGVPTTWSKKAWEGFVKTTFIKKHDDPITKDHDDDKNQNHHKHKHGCSSPLSEAIFAKDKTALSHLIVPLYYNRRNILLFFISLIWSQQTLCARSTWI
mmetsp:Transcript_35786/g.83295  ORF Transcript_35786/g.83295 Transcript_35786/m.83295 type:complete len:117 (-) Transcript_35786:724-1074(-)